MSCGSASKFSEVCYSRVGLWVGKPYPFKWVVKFSLSIINTTLWESNYSEYQQYLFNRICGYKHHFLTPIGYRKISQIFNEEGLKTPRESTFQNNHIHSIYKKGKIREERMSREDKEEGIVKVLKGNKNLRS